MVGIICALNIEVQGLKEKMTEISEQAYAKMSYTKGKIGATDVVAVECGIGKVNAAMCAQIMIDKFSPDVIINSGIAGALSKELNVGDIVVAKDVVQHDMDGTALGDPLGEIWFNDEKRIDIPTDDAVAKKLLDACTKLENTKSVMGRVATGDVFVSDVERRLGINKAFGADACEMEGGAIGQVCYRNQVPFAILRSISDSITHNTGMDFETFKNLASEKSIAVITEFLKS